MTKPFATLTPLSPRHVEIFYAAAVPDCAVASASSSSVTDDAVEV